MSSWASWWTGPGKWWKWNRGQGESLPVNIPAAQARFFQQVCRAGGHVIAVLNPRELLNESKV